MSDIMDTKQGESSSKPSNEDVVGEVHAIYSEEEERLVIRKIDKRLLPLMFVAYMLQFLDKISLGYSAIMGLQTDLDLHGQEYSWASCAFYFGYLFATYPITYGFVMLPLGKYLCSFMIVWSIILLLHPVASNFGGLITLRILLGIFESSISPGFGLMTSMWYKPSEHSLRHAIWFAGNSTSAVFGGLLAYGLAHIHTIAAWKVMFILFGGATLVWSIILMIFLPDSPKTAKFLTKREREIAYTRVQIMQHTAQNGSYNMAQVREAFVDPKTWLIFLYAFLTAMANGALTNFGSIIIQGFGFTTLQTYLLNIPSAVWGIMLVTGGSAITHNVKQSRIALCTFYLVLALIGALMIYELPTRMKVTRLIGTYFFASIAATFPFMMSMISSNVAGYTKRTVVNAIFFIGYCTGNIAGPQTFKSHEAPVYRTAFLTMVICMVLAIVVVAALGAILFISNNKRERKFPGAAAEVTTGEFQVNDSDLTDWEQEKTFRYKF